VDSKDYLTYKTFYSEEEAAHWDKLLKEKGFDCYVEKQRGVMDKVYAGQYSGVETFLRLRNDQFVQADALMTELAVQNIGSVDADYYLYAFSDNELRDIISKPDEWNTQDVVIAKKILLERGQSLEKTETTVLARYNELMKPERLAIGFIILGYAVALAYGFFGAIFGAVVYNAKKKLPDGNKVIAFDSFSRNNGIAMMIIGTAVLGLVLWRYLR